MPADELEKARALAKGRFVLQTESPNGLLLFGLRREVLEGSAAEPAELLAGLDAVTVEDVQRVAQDVIGNEGMRLAVIGPFDDAALRAAARIAPASAPMKTARRARSSARSTGSARARLRGSPRRGSRRPARSARIGP